MSEAKSKLPEKYDPKQIEDKWVPRWEELSIFRWDSTQPRENNFVVDTPPPTVSGSLHVGHVFSYTQSDVLVRYQRMLGKNIFYPIGWDDNGLPTERRVQNYYGIRCDPRLPYQAGWTPTKVDDTIPEKERKVIDVSRKNFIEACAILTREDEEVFKKLWKRVALSYDWSTEYATIDRRCQKISQFSFLDLVKKGYAYSTVAPTMWDCDFKSAIAQAELEDRERPGAFHDIRFGVEGGGEFVIATTRPELLAACIAVVAHPEDKRYQHLFGKKAITPLFHAAVPILPAEHADPEKGSGILMVCTFGDIMDVEWWRRSGLPVKQIIGLDGKIIAQEHGKGSFKSENIEAANAAYSQIAGLYINQAQRKVVELLSKDGSAVDGKGTALVGQPKPLMHVVKFYEKGDRPIEFISTRQWFVKIMDHKDKLLEQGRKVQWHPAHMLTRYEHWVEGLNQDWCISRQRFFGVPFPVWYPIQQNGQINYDSPIFADEKSLPIDPLSDVAPGYSADQRDKPGGFCGDPDVMDTWATSSLTPQLESHWSIDAERHKKLFPMDMRPQAHEIIRTWAFYTIVKAWMHEGEIPWKHAAISGFIMDPDRKKMSKSKGNVIVPGALLEEHSVDAVRYWAARARLGIDTPFDNTLFKIGNKLITKIFNASKFVLLQFDRVGLVPGGVPVDAISEPLDLALVDTLRKVIQNCTSHFEKYDAALALQAAEDAFWGFCDHYLELVKVRSYTEQDTAARRSAFATLSWAQQTFLRLLAPFLPYVTEEIWQSSFAGNSRGNSVHTTTWPTIEEVATVKLPTHEKTFAAALEIISKIRGTKTEARKSLKWEVTTLTIEGAQSDYDALVPVLDDVLSAGNVIKSGLTFKAGEVDQGGMFKISLTLSEQAPV